MTIEQLGQQEHDRVMGIPPVEPTELQQKLTILPEASRLFVRFTDALHNPNIPLGHQDWLMRQRREIFAVMKRAEINATIEFLAWRQENART